MTKNIAIRVGEMAIDKDDVMITTLGIGSCLVVCLYDKESKVGGMAHAMLSTSRDVERAGQAADAHVRSPKYVDDAIEMLIEGIERLGGHRKNIEAKLVGGAHMFKTFSSLESGIGFKNIEMAKKKLEEEKVLIASEETSGSTGRTASFYLKNGILDVNIKM